jgi:hypothetical protein
MEAVHHDKCPTMNRRNVDVGPRVRNPWSADVTGDASASDLRQENVALRKRDRPARAREVD